MSNVVIVPTYNERENIRPLVEQLLALPIEIQVIVVDDNSPDGTGAIADELAASNSHVRVIHRSGKLGLGTAYVAGFKAALSMGADRILTMDADFSHHPRYVPDLVDRSRDADLVIGSRYVRGGGTRYCTLPRKALSWGANAFVKMVLWLQAMDCTAGFRCYRREVLESIDLDTIFSNGYSFLIEMLYRVQRRGWRVAEVPIIFEDRRLGRTKMSWREAVGLFTTILRLRWRKLRGRIKTR